MAAVVNLLSQPVTDLDATPIVKQVPSVIGGVIREAVGFVTTNSDDSIGSTYRICRVPSNARITQILGSQDVGSASAGIADVGVYQTAANGGAVVDADFFASAWDFNVLGDCHNVDITHEAGAGFLVNEDEKYLWEALGLSTDSNREYDIVLTLTEAIATGATVVGLKVRYVLDN
jgi:hypothetical protein